MDYIKVKTGKGAEITYMLNYQCFEKLAMSGDSKESETIRMYFVKLREFITDNQHSIYQAVTNKKNLNICNGLELIYVIAVDERKKNLLKPGSTRKEIIERLINYNVGRIKEVELKYLAVVKNAFLIELPQIKKAIQECFCKHVKTNEAEQLYEEMSNLLGLYAYTKNKKNIAPYAIIGNDL